MVEEGELDVGSVAEALEWLRQDPGGRLYTSQGLVVRLDRELRLAQISLIQIYVNGRKPATMPGARDDAITITATATSQPTTRTREPMKGTFMPMHF
jgi:hypothetical protein